MKERHRSDPRLQAWFSLMQAEHVVGDRLDEELRTAAGLHRDEYRALLALDASDGSLERATLAEAALLDASATRRVVTHLAAEGLVHLEPNGRRERDVVVLTDPGRARLHDASAAHLVGVRTLFLDRLTQKEARALRASMRKVLEGNGAHERLL